MKNPNRIIVWECLKCQAVLERHIHADGTYSQPPCPECGSKMEVVRVRTTGTAFVEKEEIVSESSDVRAMREQEVKS